MGDNCRVRSGIEATTLRCSNAIRFMFFSYAEYRVRHVISWTQSNAGLLRHEWNNAQPAKVDGYIP